MKTLVVVSALLSLAIAAPALPGDGFENKDHPHLQAQSSLPDSLKREKKSPSEITTNGVSNSEVPNVHIDAGSSTPMGRSFSLKKPLIVKKKYGYQLYRDSEEEKAHADSNETCGRQVKVKLCNEDDKFRPSVAGSTQESSDIHTSEDDVKHSIKMAKEAVENLQRDLKKMELKTDMKSAHESQSDTELHEDIEVARQALKHIHENFGNLESMSLHATATRNSEDMHDVHLTISKTEEERMAQWKEALENIQKNVEIARNIEDSFKSASNQENTLHLDQSGAASTITDKKTEENTHSHAALSEVNNLRLAQNAVLETHHQEKEAAEETNLNMATNEHLNEHNAKVEQNIEDDMNTAPSEMIEIHLNNIKSQDALKSENHKIHEHEKSAEAKLEEHNAHIENKDLVKKQNVVDHDHQERSSEFNMDMSPDQSEHHIMQVPSIKAVEEETETKSDVEKVIAFKNSENIHVAPITTNTIIKPSTSDASSEHQKSAEQKTIDDKIEHHLKKEKSADDLTPTDDMVNFFAKSADHLGQNKLEKEHLHKEHITEQAKAVENAKSERKEHLVENSEMKPKEAVEIKHLDNIPKSAEHLEDTHFQNVAEHNKNVMLAKSADHISLQDHQKQQMIQHEELSSIETAPEMKAAEEHLHHLQQLHNAHWANENRHLEHLSSMKAAEELDKEFQMAHRQAHGHGIITEHTMDHLRNSHLAEHSQIPSKMGASHDFELASHVQPHPHHPARYHQNSMTHSQLHEMGGMGMHSNFHPNMRDAMEGFGSDHMFRWKPAHESARSAYGSGLSSSSGSTGAVGVFPNANTGGCAIPLLLSCSPSVVSGSLAKTHSAGPSSYSSPAYRTEDDFSFHNKRDIKKVNDVRTTNALRTAPIVKQKSSVALENKI